jgi:hypothetical protein
VLADSGRDRDETTGQWNMTIAESAGWCRAPAKLPAMSMLTSAIPMAARFRDHQAGAIMTASRVQTGPGWFGQQVPDVLSGERRCDMRVHGRPFSPDSPAQGHPSGFTACQ